MKDDPADYGMSRVWEADKCSSFFEKNVGMGNNKRKNRIIRHEREDKSDTCKY